MAMEEDDEGDVMMEESMPMQVSANSMAAAPQKKAKAKTTSNIGGKKRLNDEVSATLFKMSKYWLVLLQKS